MCVSSQATSSSSQNLPSDPRIMGNIYQEIQLILHGIWRRRWIALGVAWGVCLIGWIVVSMVPNRYESQARVFVQMQSLLSDKIGVTPLEQQRDIDRVKRTLTSTVNLEKVADARNWRANELMYYALMLHARGKKGCHSFDFGRSKAGTGPASFKKNFGFEPTELHYAKRALDGGEIRDINPLSPKYRMQIALWQKLPLPVANMIGPWISRGLG
jgi:hypothetical protein